MITTQNSLPPESAIMVDEILLSVRTPNLIMKSGAITKMLKDKSGTTIRFSRYDRLPTAPVQLSISGADKAATPLVRVDLDATVGFYGLYCAINQRVLIQNQDAVLAETAELLGLSMRMTEDQLTKDMLAATATFYNCTGGTNGIA